MGTLQTLQKRCALKLSTWLRSRCLSTPTDQHLKNIQWCSALLITNHPVLKDLIGNSYVSSYTLNHDCETFRLRILILSSLPSLCTFLSHNINTVKTQQAHNSFCGYNSHFTRLLTAVAFATIHILCLSLFCTAFGQLDGSHRL